VAALRAAPRLEADGALARGLAIFSRERKGNFLAVNRRRFDLHRQIKAN